jgi:hypothetical protein
MWTSIIAGASIVLVFLITHDVMRLMDKEPTVTKKLKKRLFKR